MGIIDQVSAALPARSQQFDRRTAPARALALKDDFDQWLMRFFEEPWGHAIDYPSVPVPEVRDTDREFTVRADVPGFDRSDLEITIDRGALVIRAARREDGQEQRMVQTVSLPRDIDPDRGEARVERGVLTVRFPRQHSPDRSRRIPVVTK